MPAPDTILPAPVDPSLLTGGGPMIWVLLAMAAVAAVLFVERTIYLHRAQIRAREWVDGIKNILAKRRLVEALTVCEETPGPVAAVVKAALLHAHDDEARLRLAVQEAGIAELPGLERRLGALAAIAQTAPMVGLLGTVLGMATTFHAFATGAAAYATAAGLSRGMWWALLSTAGSLALTIPVQLAGHFLGGRVRAIVRDIEWSANEIMRYLLGEYRSGLSADGGDPALSSPVPNDPPAAALISADLDLPATPEGGAP
jgi:biopolymer transport protein ExbB